MRTIKTSPVILSAAKNPQSVSIGFFAALRMTSPKLGRSKFLIGRRLGSIGPLRLCSEGKAAGFGCAIDVSDGGVVNGTGLYEDLTQAFRVNCLVEAQGT